MGLIWVWCWFAQSVSGWSAYNAELLEHEQPALSWAGYLGSADFWQTTLQNWQSEFLAVGSMAVLVDLPAPARLAGVKAGRLPPRHDRGRRLTQRPGGGFEAAVDPGTADLMAKDHGSSVKNDKQYEGLRKKGMSKSRAAAIANSEGSSSRGGKKSGSGSASKSSSSQGGTSQQKKAAGRKGGKAAANKS